MIDTESEPGAWEREIAMRPKTQEAGGRVRDKYKLMPVEPTAEIVSAMMTSRAVDAEGAFPLLMDLIDCSGENKTRTIVRAAYAAAIAAAPSPEWVKVSERLPALEDADRDGYLWAYDGTEVHEINYTNVLIWSAWTHWMPKPLARPPEPPEGDESEGERMKRAYGLPGKEGE